MKLALLSDVHANLPALEACLAHARAMGAARVALLGDLVGYGPHPAQVVERAIALAAAGNVLLRGNHDEAAQAPVGQPRTAEELSAAWTHRQLSAGQRAFIAGLPLAAAVGTTLLVHASADEPQAWHYVDQPALAQRCMEAAELAHGAHHVFCGHVHAQRLFYHGRVGKLMSFEPVPGVAVPLRSHRRWLATVGSVGQPRDGDPRAMYALFDMAQEQLSFHRVPYDHRSTAAAIRAAGLPEAFALRLEQGR
jgi:diadenosine tetraphosphatase ApaH/serine/threonine PP2A family protein phosphatase